MSPDADERLLGRVLCGVLVSQDAVGRLEEARMTDYGEGAECTGIAVLCPDHEVLVHAPTSL